SLTGYLSATYSLTTPIYLAAVMSATSVLCTATLLKGGPQSHHAFDDREAALRFKTYAKYFGRPGLRERLLPFLFFLSSFSLFISGFALFAERRFTYQGRPFGPREIGYVFGYVGFLGIILQGGLIGRLVKRFGESTLVAAGFIALVIGYFGLGIASSFTLLMLTGTLAAFGNGVIRPALTSLITQQAGRQEQGVVLGITQSLMSMASIVSPVVAGLLIERQMLREWAWVAAGLAAIGIAFSREGLSFYPTASADSIGAPGYEIAIGAACRSVFMTWQARSAIVISFRARSASAHSPVTFTVNAVKRSGEPSSVPLTSTFTFVIA